MKAVQQEHHYALHLLFLQFILQHSLLFLQTLPFSLPQLEPGNSEDSCFWKPAKLNSDVDGTAGADWPGANKTFKYPPKPPPLPPPKLLKLLLLILLFAFEPMLVKKELKSNGAVLVGAVFVWKPPNDN
jgi:hypothetical protein